MSANGDGEVSDYGDDVVNGDNVRLAAEDDLNRFLLERGVLLAFIVFGLESWSVGVQSIGYRRKEVEDLHGDMGQFHKENL